MTVSRSVRRNLPASRTGVPSKRGQSSGSYPMPDKKHARLAKAFAAMHHSPNEASIDRKANAILHPHGSGVIPTDAYNAGYAGMGMDDYVGMQYAQDQQQAGAQPPAQKKKKRGASYG